MTSLELPSGNPVEQCDGSDAQTSDALPAPEANRVPLPVAIDVTAISWHSGGAARYASNLVAGLPGAGVSPVLVARRRDTIEQWTGAGRFIACAPANRVARLAWEQTSLERVLSAIAPDVHVLHSPHYTHPEWGRPEKGWSKKQRRAHVVTIHDVTFFTHPRMHTLDKRLVFRRAIIRAAERADHLICVSERTADELSTELNRRRASVRAPITVIRHGIDHERFRQPLSAGLDAADSAVLAGLGVEKPFVLFVGAIEPRKNVPSLIGAMQRVRTIRPDLTLVIAGKPWPGHEIAPEDGVVPLGFVSDDHLPALLRACSTFVYASVDEGFGLPVLEALACGAPTVTTKGSVMSALADGAVIETDPSDTSTFARSILDAVEGLGPSLSARTAAVSTFRWDTAVAKHAAVYRSLGVNA